MNGFRKIEGYQSAVRGIKNSGDSKIADEINGRSGFLLDAQEIGGYQNRSNGRN